MKDIDGEHLPSELWHGSVDGDTPDRLLSAAEVGGWWRIIDPALFERLNEDDLDSDETVELDHECRTAYGNIAYQALKGSNDPHHRQIASEYGLERLGEAVSILFVSGSRSYVESTYGPAVEIDIETDGLLLAVYDENALKADSWMLVFEAGIQFPLKVQPAPAF